MMRDYVGSVYRPKSVMVAKPTLRLALFFMLLMYPLFAGLTDFKTINEAKQAYEAKEYAKSVKLLDNLDAKSPEKQYAIGSALYKDKQYDEALKAYEKAYGIDEASRLHNIGNTHFQKQAFDKAIEAYEKALKFKEDEDTKFNMALAKKEKKKKEEDKKKQEEKKKDDKKQDDKKKKENDKKKEGDKKKDKKGDKKKKDKKKKDENKKDKDKDKDKKEGDKKKSDSKKDKKGDKEGEPSKAQKQKSKEEKLKEQELKRLMKKIQKGKTPTIMYQMGESKKGQRINDANPW